jgi:signal transduction histidine kinase
MNNVSRGWDIVKRNQDRINDLVLDLLHYTRKSDPNLQRQNVNAVLREVIELVAPRAAEKQVTVVQKLDSELPEIWIDAAGIHHACLNILVNAVDAVEPRTGKVTVATSLETRATNGRGREPEQEFLITVSDNGKGIPEAQLTEIFRAFHSTKGGKGTGLGLAVSHKIIAEHQGTIEVESHVGAGSTFTIRLPVVKPRSSEDTGAPIVSERAV